MQPTENPEKPAWERLENFAQRWWSLHRRTLLPGIAVTFYCILKVREYAGIDAADMTAEMLSAYNNYYCYGKATILVVGLTNAFIYFLLTIAAVMAFADKDKKGEKGKKNK